jgi:hypothetical protein
MMSETQHATEGKEHHIDIRRLSRQYQRQCGQGRLAIESSAADGRSGKEMCDWFHEVWNISDVPDLYPIASLTLSAFICADPRRKFLLLLATSHWVLK